MGDGTLVDRVLRPVTAAVATGLLVGGVIGGIGGRLVMRLLAVTSDDSLRGALTTDDEVVGEVTLGGTVFFVYFMALVGAVVLGMAYLIAREVMPHDLRVRAIAWAVLMWCVGATVVFDADSFDFTDLGPAWLAVSLFSVLFLVAGWASAAGIEVALRSWPAASWGSWWAYVPLVALLPVPPLLVLVVVVGALVQWRALRNVVRVPSAVVALRALVVLGTLALGAPALLEAITIIT
jgi:hypothetical protein